MRKLEHWKVFSGQTAELGADNDGLALPCSPPLYCYKVSTDSTVSGSHGWTESLPHTHTVALGDQTGSVLGRLMCSGHGGGPELGECWNVQRTESPGRE